MQRTIRYLIGLICIASLVRGIGFSQLKFDSTGAGAYESSKDILDVGDKKQAIIIDLNDPIPLFDIVGLNVDQKSNGYLIRIHCTKQVPDFESWLKPIGGDTWLYVTLADARADITVLQDFKLTAFVKKILVFQSETSAQLTFMLTGQVNSIEIMPMAGSQDILVAVFTPKEEQLALRKDR